MKEINNKPRTLYRGIIMQYPLPKDFKFEGIVIEPPHKPLIDKLGRKTVLDGNEYGVYMTDYLDVAEVYARTDEEMGTKINPDIPFSNYPKRYVTIPPIGIIYKIDTNNLEVHKPWITSTLKGHYNNGFAGDEWITEKIPPTNYKVERVQIGADFLHERETIDISNPDKISEIITTKMEARIERLKALEKYLEKQSSTKRYSLDSLDLEILKDIYKENGIRKIDLQNFRINNSLDCINFLMAKHYFKNSPDNIDFNTLSCLYSLKINLKDNQISTAVALLGTVINEKISDRSKFIERKEKNHESYTTFIHDKKIKFYQDLLHELIEKLEIENKNLQVYYTKIVIKTDKLLNNKIVSQNKEKLLADLLKQKEFLNNLITERRQIISKYYSEFFYNEDDKTIISNIEKMLNIKISANALYVNEATNDFQMVIKNEKVLKAEELKIASLLEKLYSSGKINIQKYQIMLNTLHLKYQEMITESKKNHTNKVDIGNSNNRKKL